MSLLGVSLAVFGQLVLAYLLFMLVAFSAGALANGGNLSPGQLRALNACLIGLPAACVLCASVLVAAYIGAGSARWYWLQLVTPLGGAAYVRYAVVLGRRRAS